MMVAYHVRYDDDVFVVNDTATTEIYTYGHTLSLHDALPICRRRRAVVLGCAGLLESRQLCPPGWARRQRHDRYRRWLRPVLRRCADDRDRLPRSGARRVRAGDRLGLRL